MNQQSLRKISIYDTTLRDGTQRKGISLSVGDKLKIASILDRFGVDYIEGGWPGSNPKDMEFFRRAKAEKWDRAALVAFGSTRRKGVSADADPNLKALIDAQTPAVELVGKSSVLHVETVLEVSKEENLDMVRESIAFMKANGREVFFAAEHFFDGFASDSSYTTSVLEAAIQGGVDWLVLCDTNGGTLPADVAKIVTSIRDVVGGRARLSIHAHNDSEVAVANSIAAVAAGVDQVQGTINGYGERCGNANLISIIANLQCKMDYRCIEPAKLRSLTEISRLIAEIANVASDAHAPYVGAAAFAHKGGIHVAAVEKLSRSYEHVDPETIGNRREIVVSELSGRGNIRMMAQELNCAVSGLEGKVLDEIKALERKGFQFEAAAASLDLLMRRAAPDYSRPFLIDDALVVCRSTGEKVALASVQASVKVRIGSEIYHTVSEGDGPVHALDGALRLALTQKYPRLAEMRLIDYKVRILDPEGATAATARVIIEAAEGANTWSTVGCSQNVIQASLEALSDSFEYFITRQNSEKRLAPIGQDTAPPPSAGASIGI